jgi:carbon storage regulator
VLVLTRKRNQSIVIGDDIEVAVIDIRGDQVRLGVAAPGRVAVHRRELFSEIEKANLAAACRCLRLAAVVEALPAALRAGQIG